MEFYCKLKETPYKSLKFMFSVRKCLPAIHFFVKIKIFKLSYFLEFEADLYETAHFC